jgi:hypothetical protein
MRLDTSSEVRIFILTEFYMILTLLINIIWNKRLWMIAIAIKEVV